MRSPGRTGRLAGMLLGLQLAGLIVPFVLLLPLSRGTGSYLANAATAAPQIRLAVFLLLATCALTIAITITVLPEFRRHSEATALSLLAAGVILFLLQAVDNVHVLSMLALSRQAHAGGPAEHLDALAAVVGSSRRWAHLTALLAIDAWFFLLYGGLYRFALVPRPLAAFGLLTVGLHCTAVPLRGFLDLPPIAPLAASMGVGQVTVAAWLVARGFGERRAPGARAALA